MSQIADLLREHGALDEVPDFKTIRVTRQDMAQPIVVFRADTNGWNQFSLFETIERVYALNESAFRYPGNPATFLPFPALTRIIVHRPNNPPGGKEREITVSLLDSTNGVDCGKDMMLEFGDVVEIPMRDHPLNETPTSLSAREMAGLYSCTKGTVQLKVHGQSKALQLNPTAAYLSEVLGGEGAQSLLLSSSDLSRVKVTRRDPKTGKTREWILDCSTETVSVPARAQFPVRLGIAGNANEHSSDLWLRDGDVIVVPEK